MEEKKKIHIKHIEIWIILFVIALGAGITAIVLGIKASKGDNTEKGYQVVPLQEEAEIPLYGYDFDFVYYVEGTKLQNQERIDAISADYSHELAYLYASLDEATVYEHYPSIGKVNKAFNEEVTLSEFTYNTLYDAYQKTVNGVNYSIFAEPIYTYWYSIFNKLTKEEVEAADPFNNTTSAEVLTNLSNYIKDRNHIDLEFLGENKVKLSISEEYKTYLTDYGLEGSAIGLNNLKTAYIAKNIVKFLRQYNYTGGYLHSRDGMIFQLDLNYTIFRYNYYDAYINNEGTLVNVNAADVTLNPYSYVLSNRRFAIDDGNVAYYFIKHDDVYYYRSLYIDITTGLPHNEVLSTTFYGDSNSDILELSYYNNELAKFTTIEEMRDYISTHNLSNNKILIGFNDTNKNIFYSESIKDYISLSEELDYNLIKI